MLYPSVWILPIFDDYIVSELFISVVCTFNLYDEIISIRPYRDVALRDSRSKEKCIISCIEFYRVFERFIINDYLKITSAVHIGIISGTTHHNGTRFRKE